ncbi:MAG: CARDB domain-containing protein [Acidobacteriota bacterium]
MKKLNLLILSLLLIGSFAFAQSINVSLPNGGEDWTLGSSKNITWTATGLTNDVKITLWKNNVFLGLIAKDIDPSSGSYPWTVGTYTDGTAPADVDYKIKIREQGGESFTTEDMSDENFTIVKVIRSVTQTMNIPRDIRKPVLVEKPRLELQNPMIGFLPNKCNIVKFAVDIKNVGSAAAQNIPYKLEINGPAGTVLDNWVQTGTLPCPTIAPDSTCKYTKETLIEFPGMYYYTFKVDPDNANNLYKKVNEQIVQQHPDLIVHISPMTFNLAFKSHTYFYVKNQGRACSKPSILRTYMERKGVKKYTIPSLRPGDIYQVIRTEKYFALGTITIAAIADYTKLVDEGQFENNNEDKTSKKIKSATKFDSSGLRRAPEGFFPGNIINK